MMNFLSPVPVPKEQSFFTFQPSFHWNYLWVSEHEYHDHIAYFAVSHWILGPYGPVSLATHLSLTKMLFCLLGSFCHSRHGCMITFFLLFIDHHESAFPIVVFRFMNNVLRQKGLILTSFCCLIFLVELYLLLHQFIPRDAWYDADRTLTFLWRYLHNLSQMIWSYLIVSYTYFVTSNLILSTIFLYSRDFSFQGKPGVLVLRCFFGKSAAISSKSFIFLQTTVPISSVICCVVILFLIFWVRWSVQCS